MDEKLNVKKKVMLLSPDFGFGGAERSIANLSVLLSACYEIHYVVFNRDMPAAYHFAGQLHCLNVSGSPSWLGKIMAFRKRVVNLSKLKKQLKVDICISFLEGSDYVNILSKQSERVCISIRGSKRHDKNIKGLIGFFRNRVFIPCLYNKADHIVTVAHGIKGELIESYSLSKDKAFSVIPNFYNLTALQRAGNEALSEDWECLFNTSSVIAAVGRLSPEKGFHYLIHVFFEMRQRKDDLKLLLVGSGTAETEIKQTIKEKGLAFSNDPKSPADVYFAGYQKNPLKFVKRAKIFVLSSLTEGFPNALVEAMSVGVPVVAADCPYGPSEILGGDPKSGILLPVLSEDSRVIDLWASTILALLENTALQNNLSQLAVKRVEDFNDAEVLRQWRAIIENG